MIVNKNKKLLEGPGSATITSRSQPPTQRGREEGQNACKINKQMHEKHLDQLFLPQAR